MDRDLLLMPLCRSLQEKIIGISPEQSNILCRAVTESNKDHLFKDAIAGSRTNSQGPSTETVLRRLRELDPWLSQRFKLKTSDRVEAPLRLLSECIHHDGNGDPQYFSSYIALSYCWHSSAWEPITGYNAHVDPRFPGWQWPISEKMFRALLDERQSTSEGIWIDAISIVQTDEQEKAEAIEAMNVIYKSARLVVIILEDIEISSHEEDVLRQCETEGKWSSNFHGASDQPLLTDDHMRPLAATLIRILSARWFERAFCSQEMQLAKESVFLVPGQAQVVRIPQSTLEWMHYVTIDYVQSHEDLFDRMSEVAMSYDLLTRVNGHAYGYNPQNTLSLPYLSMFRDLLLLGCSELRDKLSIAINVFSWGISYNGRVENIGQCRWILAMLALAAGDATVLCCQGDFISFEKGSSNPSGLQWPDDDESISLMPDIHPKLIFDSRSIANHDGKFCLDLYLLNSKSLYRPTAESSAAATDFVWFFLSEYAETLKGLNPIWRGLEDDLWSRDFLDHLSSCRDILACSLDCGIHWISNAMARSSTLKFLPSESETLECSWEVICTNLFSDNDMRVMKELGVQNFMDSFLKYLTFLFSRTLEDFGGTNIARLAIGPSAQGGITPFHDDHEVVLAIPAALADSEFCTIRRLWYLKPVGPRQDGIWQIVRKEMLFGAPSVTADGEHIELMRSQRLTT